MAAYDLDNLYIKFHECPDGVRLVDHFSELKAYDEFRRVKDENFIKLAILTGDIDSPISTITERSVMVGAAFDILNIDRQKNKRLFDKVVDYSHAAYMDCWLKYLYIQNEVQFTNWLLATRDYEFYLSQSNIPIGKDEDEVKYMDKRAKLRQNISKLGQEKKDLEARLFPDSKAAREASVREAKNKIHTWAEEYGEEFNYF